MTLLTALAPARRAGAVEKRLLGEVSSRENPRPATKSGNSARPGATAPPTDGHPPSPCTPGRGCRCGAEPATRHALASRQVPAPGMEPGPGFQYAQFFSARPGSPVQAELEGLPAFPADVRHCLIAGPKRRWARKARQYYQAHIYVRGQYTRLWRVLIDDCGQREDLHSVSLCCGPGKGRQAALSRVQKGQGGASASVVPASPLFGRPGVGSYPDEVPLEAFTLNVQAAHHLSCPQLF